VITEADIAHWQRHAPWPTLEQVEQDLVLSRLIVEVANHPLLSAVRGAPNPTSNPNTTTTHWCIRATQHASTIPGEAQS